MNASLNRFNYSRWAIASGALVAVLIAVSWMASPALSRVARDRILEVLKEDFASELEVRNLRVTLFPHVRITGEDLVFHYRGRTDLPPLLTIRKLSGVANIAGLLRRHIQSVRVEGLEIHVPPHDERPIGEMVARAGTVRNFVVDEVIADGTKLAVMPKDAGKNPLEWNIQGLTLRGFGSQTSASFRATLTNAKPPGLIYSTGKFGPWNKEEPADTPVSGDYRFTDADLSVFQGISGKLSSEGSYRGVLGRLEAEGQTDTPDFALTISGNPVDLTCQFQAVVDGTDGNTRLQRVTAQFGHTAITAQGSIVGTKGVKGKTVSLDVAAEDARLEDLLLLGAKEKTPAMTGSVNFHSKLIVPAGAKDIIKNLKLDGGFDVDSAHFSKVNVQDKVNQLSHRGSGKPEESEADTVASDFSGQFALDNGVMAFEKLAFHVPGIGISLDGRYVLANEQLDFHGTARLEAKLSQTTTGFKSFLLKAVDPLFKRKNAGTVVPIAIGGTAAKPSFGLDLHRGR